MDVLWLHIVQWLHTVGLHVDAGTAREVAGGMAQATQKLDMPSLLALAAALGWASGFRLYAVVFIVGLMGAIGALALPTGLHVLENPLVLAVAGCLMLVEFFADKVPWIDSTWDAIHTVIRVPGGALLAAGVFLLGGSLAATSMATKMTTRAAVNTSPEPFSNGLVSLFEDGLAVGVVWLSTQHPVAFGFALVAMVVLSVLLLMVLFKFLRAVLRRLSSFFGGSQPVVENPNV